MRYVAPGLVLLFLLAPPTAFSNTTLVGSWQYKDAQLNIVADFFTDGTFRQVTTGPQGRQTFSGRYQLNGQTLYLQEDGGRAAPRIIHGKAARPCEDQSLETCTSEKRGSM
jgi:hypothetical protein